MLKNAYYGLPGCMVQPARFVFNGSATHDKDFVSPRPRAPCTHGRMEMGRIKVRAATLSPLALYSGKGAGWGQFAI
jgi:hypothetical protein